jgi:uncharacterized protein (DUF1800 family)
MQKGRFITVVSLALAMAISGTFLVAKDKKDKKKANSASTVAQMDERQQVVHALNRLTFGPRPGEVDRVSAMGLQKWIDQQLNPDKISDNAVETRLAQYRTLRMSNKELVENFPPNQVLKAVAEGKMGMPRDAERRAVYQAGVARYEAKKEKKEDQADAQQPMQDDGSQMSDEEKAHRRDLRLQAVQKAESLLQLSPDPRMKQIMAMDADDRRVFWRALPPANRQALTADLTSAQKETLLALENPLLVVNGELMAAKILRAAYSERQLDEVMTDFWFNHFNVFIGKGADRYLITSYERDVIRPHALGKFQDLLLATAKSPAMLWYLDNWQSVGPHSDAATGAARRQQFQRPRRVFGNGPFGGGMRPFPNDGQAQNQKAKNKAPRGLNENYAREVMELHTLGVNGGYTQKDVTELARVLTGWTISEPRRGGGYDFNDRMHEPGEKIVLGKKFKDHGEREGEDALKMLAHEPATAHFICTKLATRFVSDEPPAAIVDRMAETFLKSDGDIKSVLKTMFDSPEFWAPAAYRAKVKTPFEFVVSSLRATGAQVDSPAALIQQLNKMGQPLYGAQPPTGYSMKAETWVNSSALLNRMNYALALGTGKIPGVQSDSQQVIGADTPQTSDSVLARFESSLLNGDLSRQTHDTISTRMNDPAVTGRKLDDAPRPVQAGVVAGLILGSPEFQRR